MADDFENDWRSCVVNVDTRRVEYFAALDGDKTAKQEASRQFWEAIGLLMACYNRPQNWPNGRPVDASTLGALPRFAISPVLAKIIGNQAMYLANGEVPASITDVRGKGRTAPGPHETRDMAVAVAFVASVRAGETVGIRAPIKTTAEAYGISVRTLQKWTKTMTWVSKDDFGPPGALRVQFDKSAENYRAAGRSASALVARARTRARD